MAQLISMSDQYKKFYRFDNDPEGIVWRRIPDNFPEAYCAEHLVKPRVTEYINDTSELKCLVDNKVFLLAAPYAEHQKLAEALLKAQELKSYKTIRIDPTGVTVLAKERFDNLIEGYFITAKVTDTNKGVEIMIQVGKRSPDTKKVQLFVEPPRQRLSFDHSGKDQHPSGLFTEVRAIFKDSVSIIGDKASDEAAAPDL